MQSFSRSVSLGYGDHLSNIDQVYTADPKQNPSARPLYRLRWDEFRSLVGGHLGTRQKSSFDPIAARRAQEDKLKVIVAAGTDLSNLLNILEDRPFWAPQSGRIEVLVVYRTLCIGW
jgi:uridylate kinase